VPGEAKYPKISEEFQEALSIEPLTKPIYPRKALLAKNGSVIVGVRITVDSNGHVTDMSTSMVTFSTPGPFAEDFFAAVEAAVRQWRFLPAEIQQFEMVEAPRQLFRRILSREKVETHFDLSFTFSPDGAVESR
jgi:TonB family protein